MGWDLEKIKRLNKVVHACQQNQYIVDITVYCVCSILIIPSLYLLIRAIFKVKDKTFLVSISVLSLISEISGIISASQIEKVVAVAVDYKQLLHMYYNDRDWFVRQTNYISWSLAFFFGFFNITHWIFAM